MSASNSNPLLVDPSIVTISDKDSTIPINNQSSSNSQPTTTRTSSIHSLDPSNALSKLLDSAIAHAARESTPDFIRDSKSEEAIEEESEISDEQFINSIPLIKQGRENIYSIGYLLSLRTEVEAVDLNHELPEKSFWRLSKNRSAHENVQSSSSSSYRKKGRRGGGGGSSGNGTNYNETWERKNSASSGSNRNHHSLGFNKSHELDQLSKDKISQLLGEQENELDTPEWDDIGLTGGDNGMNMGQTVEDFEKWKYQMKLEERKKNGESIDEELELRNNTNAAAVNAGNEVDNFFSFVKQDEPQDNKAIENEEVETPTNEDKPHRSSRFSSFFHQPKAPASPAENPVNPQQTSAQSTPSGPPPGFSKFFGGQPPQQAPTPPQQHQQSQPPQIHPQQPPHVLERHGSSVSSQGSIPAGPPAASSNDNFFMALLHKKESEQQSPISTKSTPNSNKELTPGGRKITPEELQQLQRQQQQQGPPPPHMQQMPPQFPPQGIPPNQIPPWLRGGPPPPGTLPPHLQGKGFPQPPPGFVPPQQGQQPPVNPQQRQGQPQQGQQQGQQQQQTNQRGPPPPGMFPPGYMPGPPGSSNFMPPPMPQQFMNNPNARFIPPQYMGMPLPPHMANNQGQQQQQQQQSPQQQRQGQPQNQQQTEQASRR
ncbi:hypothetical protein K6H11_000184 [Candida tropicalis]